MTRVVLLHGVGGSGAAMLPLADALGIARESCFAPDGPQPFDMGPGRQWFSVRGITEADRPGRVAAELPAVAKILRGFGPAEQFVLIGFSQGAIMALHAAAAGLPVAAVVALSGRLAGPVAARKDWPPIHLLHGEADPVIPVAFARATSTWLTVAGAAPMLTVLPGLGHSTDLQALRQVVLPLIA